MCLIIAPGADGTPALLPRSAFDYAYLRNQDGFGAMWTEDGQVNHFKTLGMSADETYEYMQAYVRDHPDVIFHLRLKTHGKITPGLSHPFRVLHRNRHGKDLFFMHNGILGQFGNDLKPGQSDTTAFKDKILVPLLTRNPDALDDESIMDALSKLTSGSRLIFMDSEGMVHRTKQNADWNNRYGLSLSNTYMLPSEYVAPKTTHTLGNPNLNGQRKNSGLYTHYRRVRWSEGSETSVWCTPIEGGFVRSESGMLFRDRGVATTIDWKTDYIQKNDEYKYLSVEAYLDSPHSFKESDGGPNYADLDDDVPAFLNDDEEEERVSMGTNVVKLTTTTKPVHVADTDAKLRYARLFQNTQSKLVESREQLLADLLGMGQAEMYSLIEEDPKTSHVIMEELCDIIFELNTVVGMSPDIEEYCFDADHLLTIGSAEHHRESMISMSEIRRDRYRKELADKVKKEAEKREEDILDVSMVNEG